MGLGKKTIDDENYAGKRVLVRCDFNVPLDGTKITDETRIVAALPTIKYLLDHNAAVILCSHLGRPKGEFNMKYSLAPVAERLSEKLDKLTRFVNGTVFAALPEDERELLVGQRDAMGVYAQHLHNRIAKFFE